MSFGDTINSTNAINTATMESLTNNNNNNNKKCGTRRVSFNSMAELYLTQTASSSLSEIDASALWWTSEDYKTNKRKNKILARHCRGISGAALHWNCDDCDSEHEHKHKHKHEHEHEQDDEHDHRGLESIMDGGRCRALAQRTVETVRKEQARHLLDGVEGEASGRFIARIYRRQSLPSKMRAERLGELDAIAARTALKSDWEREPEHEPEDEHEHEHEHDSEAHDETPVCEDRDDVIAIDHEKENNEAANNNTDDNNNQPKAATKLFRRSPERGRFPTNFRISITNVIHRRRHAWI